MKSFSFTNARFGDTFNVSLDEDNHFAFIGAIRFVGNIGQDGIIYESLEEIPPIYRHEITERINAIQRKHSK